MILVDTSVWIDYLRKGGGRLSELLENCQVLTHPAIIGELACGNLSNRKEFFSLVDHLPTSVCASDTEVLTFIERHELMGKGIGYIDAHLLTSVQLSHGAQLWTNDTRLAAVAGELATSH